MMERDDDHITAGRRTGDPERADGMTIYGATNLNLLNEAREAGDQVSHFGVHLRRCVKRAEVDLSSCGARKSEEYRDAHAGGFHCFLGAARTTLKPAARNESI